MKKPVLFAIIAGVIAVIGLVVFIFFNNQQRGANSGMGADTSGGDSFVAVDACRVLTQEIADDALGGASQKASATTPTIQTSDLIVSQCLYSRGVNGVGLLVRSARTAAGTASNQAAFGDQKPHTAEDVTDVGDAAFYEPNMGQLNILAGNNWYILTNYKETVSNTSLDANLQVAKRLTLL